MGCDTYFTYYHTTFFVRSFNNSVVSPRNTCRLHLDFIMCCSPKLQFYQDEPLAIMHSVYAKQRKLVTVRTCNSSYQVYYHSKSIRRGKKASNLQPSGVHSLQSSGGWTTERR